MDKLIVAVEKKCGDAQVLDAAISFGGECGDDRMGAPAKPFSVVTFDRVPMMNPPENAIPARTRLSRCLAAATAVQADTGAAAVYALSDFGPFSFGVAAGDATPTTFIAWTRLATGALTPVTLEIATNPDFTPVAQMITGLVPNLAADDTIKVDVTGWDRTRSTSTASRTRRGRAGSAASAPPLPRRRRPRSPSPSPATRTPSSSPSPCSKASRATTRTSSSTSATRSTPTTRAAAPARR